MFITGGFVLGEVLALYQPVAVFVIAAGVLTGMLWWCIRKGRSRVYLLLPLCLLLGAFRMQTEQEGIRNRELIDTSSPYVKAEGRINKLEDKENSVLVLLESVEMVCKGKRNTLPRLYVYIDDSTLDGMELCIGNTVCVSGDTKAYQGARNPGQFDSRMYYLSLGIEYRMYADEVSVTSDGISLWREGLRRLRRYSAHILDRVAKAEEAGILKAAILGDKSDMDTSIKEMYQKNGISHLLAISGLHVSIMGLGIYHLLRKGGAGYGMSGVICTIFLLSYGVLTGESPSVNRAVIMLLCQCLSGYLGRTYDLVSATCLAALLLAAQFPYCLFQGGVQLSFGAVLGIGVLGRYLSGELELGRGKDVCLYGLAIQLVTYPLTLYHFFQYPIYSILLNLIVIPFMVYVIYSGLLGILLGSISVTWGTMAVGSAHYILTWYQLLCQLFERLPCYSLILGRPKWWQLILYAGILAGGCLGMRKAKRVGKVLILVIMTAGCFGILLPIPVRGLEVTCLDVGQGDGIVLRTGKAVILVDGGSTSEKELGKYRLEPYLKSAGISTIDYAVVSHGDQDHISGLLYLLKEDTGIKIRNLLLPVLGRGDEAYDSLREAARGAGTDVYDIGAGDGIEAGSLTLECLYPNADDTATDRNQQSSMMLVSYGDFSMLLTGDMGTEGEERMIERYRTRLSPKGVQVLKAGHHGSRTSTGETLLDTLRPRWTILSYEEGNSYGHPHSEVIERLNRRGISIWRTADSGAVTLVTDGKSIRWKEYLKSSGDSVDVDGDNIYNKMQ